jgi:hypothetical protein
VETYSIHAKNLKRVLKEKCNPGGKKISLRYLFKKYNTKLNQFEFSPITENKTMFFEKRENDENGMTYLRN